MIAAQLDSYFTELSFFADLDKGVTYSAGCMCLCLALVFVLNVHRDHSAISAQEKRNLSCDQILDLSSALSLPQ